MDSEVPAAQVADKVSAVVETSLTGSYPSNKNQGKVPKRIHKAAREKMKREHLNELFLALANVLELTEPNVGKASILGETSRIVKDTLAQIECLKRESAALLSESQYVTIEKDELQDENTTLQVHIGKLLSMLKEKMAQSKIDLNVAPTESQEPELASYFPDTCLRLPAVEPALHQPPIASPFFVIPLSSDLQLCPEPDCPNLATKPVSNVSKPHARYPTPADSWPSQLLEKQSEAMKEFQHTGINSSC